MKEYFLDDSKIWAAFASRRIEKLFLDVWRSLPNEHRGKLTNILHKVTDSTQQQWAPGKFARYNRGQREIEIHRARLARKSDQVIRYAIAHELAHAIHHTDSILPGGIEETEEHADLQAYLWGFPAPDLL